MSLIDTAGKHRGRVLGRVEAGHHVHDAACDAHGVVADALVEAGDEHGVDGLLTVAVPRVGVDDVKGLGVHVIKPGIVDDELLGLLFVAGLEDVDDFGGGFGRQFEAGAG